MKKISLIAVVALGMVSCSNDEKLAEELLFEEQAEKVTQLEAQLAKLREEVAKVEGPPPAVPVAELKEQLAEKKAAIAKLKEEFDSLRQAEKEAREKLEEYQRKYPLPE